MLLLLTVLVNDKSYTNEISQAFFNFNIHIALEGTFAKFFVSLHLN